MEDLIGFPDFSGTVGPYIGGVPVPVRSTYFYV